MSNLLDISLGEIRENPVALRAVDRQTENYQGLVDSIKEHGILNPINVREKTDDESGIKYYELIDGLHRYSASKDAGAENIPAQILSVEDAEVLDLQIIANIHKIETKPSEYTQQLKRILGMNPMMTITELASKLNKSPSWINDRMSLTKIQDQDINTLIDDGSIPLGNAYALSKLPPEEHANYVASAMNDAPAEFVAAVNERVKEIKENKRKGANATEAVFSPAAHMQKMRDVKEENEAGAIAKSLVASTGAGTAEDGFRLAIQWVLHLDPESVSAAREKWEAKESEKADKSKKREEEKARKKAEKAKANAEEAEKAVAALGGE